MDAYDEQRRPLDEVPASGIHNGPLEVETRLGSEL